ncbi:MAG: RDD family protein [Dehalococcoidia bacterium]|nr:RDD family protein [Dehalococcoidia bacterium]
MQTQTPTADKARYAFLWQRFAAVVIDEAITYILFVPAFLLQIAGMGERWELAAMLAAVILRYAYFVYFEHGQGQTIGKRLLRIRVRSEREDRLPLKEAAIRNLKRFDALLALVLPTDPATATGTDQLLVSAILFYTAVAPIFIWLSVKKQRPLDMIAHTIVIQQE